MNKHTKGPWKVIENEDGDAAIVMGTALNSPGYYSCKDYWTSEAEYGDPSVMANARLIAAAPDMLEALERTIRIYEDEAPIMAEDLRSVIAKAKGENND